MMILLSLVCAIQAFLTLWLYRKVTCMQAGILTAHLRSRSEVHGIKADLKTWKLRVLSLNTRLDMREDPDAVFDGVKVAQQEDPSFDEQYQDPDPPDEDPYDGSPADTR